MKVRSDLVYSLLMSECEELIPHESRRPLNYFWKLSSAHASRPEIMKLENWKRNHRTETSRGEKPPVTAHLCCI
jgi:hypothetical protein